jgi:cell shape-determining protein MreD
VIAERAGVLEKVPLARGLVLALSVAMLHVGFVSRIVVFDARPEPLLLLGLVAGLHLGAESGAAVGFLAGMFADVIGYGPLGPWALVVGLFGFAAGAARDAAFPAARERRPFLLVFGASALALVAVIGLSFAFADIGLPTASRLAWRAFFVGVANALLLLPMRALVRAAVPLPVANRS